MRLLIREFGLQPLGANRLAGKEIAIEDYGQADERCRGWETRKIRDSRSEKTLNYDDYSD